MPVRRSLQCEQLEDRRLLAAVADTYSMLEDGVLKVIQPGVQINDTPSGQKISLDGEPVGGVVEIDEQGGFVFIPSPDFFGKASFNYKAESEGGEPTGAKVTIVVKGIEDAPRGESDAYTTEMNLKLTVAKDKGILANDVEPDGEPLVMALVDTTTNGKLDLKADGSFVYVPNENYLGADSFTYTITDGKAITRPISVLIDVTIIQHIQNKPDTFATDEDTVLRVPAPGVLGNDIPVDRPLQARIVESPKFGVLTFQDDGSFEYEPAVNFNGQDTFTYRAFDLLEDGSINRITPITKVTLDVRPVNDAPVGKADRYETNVNRPLVVGQISGLARPWVGNGHYYEWVERPGTWEQAKAFAESQSLQGVAGHLATITSEAELRFVRENLPLKSGWLGGSRTEAEEDLTKGWSWVTDEEWDLALWDSAQPALPPSALNVALATDVLGTPYSWVVADARSKLEYVLVEYPVGKAPEGPLTNDTDLDGDVVSFAKVDKPPAHGEVRMSTNGYFEYRPNRGFYGTDSFTYWPNDGGLDAAAPAKITIEVLPVPAFEGDFDLDDDVDLNDFGVFKRNFGRAGDLTEGDADGDGDIDLSDFGVLKQNFGKTSDPPIRLPGDAPRLPAARALLATRVLPTPTDEALDAARVALAIQQVLDGED
jgi:hypothetical protein